MKTSLILLCAGESSRLGLIVKKQWLRINNKPLWLNVLEKLISFKLFDEIIIVAHSRELKYMQNFLDDNKIKLISGGSQRQESISNALPYVSNEFVCIHDSARVCVQKKVIKRLISTSKQTNSDCVAPFITPSDTSLYENAYLDRNNLKLIQTPQISNTSLLRKNIDLSKTQNKIFTDESSLMSYYKAKVAYSKGSEKMKKLTYKKDLKHMPCLKKYFKNKNSKNTKIGFGIDIHPFEDNKPMFLGGVKLPYDFGFKAHSDGDVLIHSIIDAMLGAIGAGDIGEFFSDKDPKYKNASSSGFLQTINTFINSVGFELNNLDLTIICEIPKITPHKQQIKTNLSKLLNLSLHKINIKATTNEKMGYIGNKEGIAVHSVASVKEIL